MNYAILVYDEVYEIVSEEDLHIKLEEYVEEFGEDFVQFEPWDKSSSIYDD